MTIDRGEFDAITLADLQELVTAQVPEGLRLEYKRELYGNSDSDKREFLKDVTSMANSHGGHLILGITEKGGGAEEVVGVDCLDTDAEILRMEQMLHGGVEPVVSGIRIKAISVAENQIAFVLRIPKSWNPPHRVVAKGSNRFYLRHSAGVHEPSVEELRALFTQSTNALDQARRFRDERISIVCSGDGAQPLAGGGRWFLHIFPVAAPSGMVNLDMELVYEKHVMFQPISTSGLSPRFNYHGFINERGGKENYGYTQIFRNGCLEATIAGIVRENEGKRGIPGQAYERYFFEVYSRYICGLRDVGVPPPLVIMITLEGVKECHYYVRRNPWDEYEPPLPNEIMRLPEGFLEDYGEQVDHHRAIRPAFDALWNAIGYSGSQFFNDDGLWVGGQR